jgi:CRP-like cAMP-binding protein
MEHPALDWQRLVAVQPALGIVPPALRRTACRLALAAGETLFRSGSAVQRVFAVVEGEVRLVRREAGGAEFVLQRARGGFVAEASLDSGAYHCDAVAAANACVVAFPAAEFRAALETAPAFSRAWQAQLAREVRRLRTQCERLCLKTAPERVVHYIRSEGTQGALALTQSRMAWASELGITHEALYRTLRRMQQDGVLEVQGPVLRLRPSP